LLPASAVGDRRRDILVAGRHLDLVREPNVAAVARALEDFFAAHHSASGSIQT
jgi:thioesterase domain-containing protein